MSFLRPEAKATLQRLAEPATAAATLAIGLWVATRGGWFLAAVGLGLAAMAAGWAVLALRRLRFQAGDAAPGMVEVDEGRITYLGPKLGGSVGLPDLIEIRILTLRGRSVWRLKQADGQVLLVPLDAAGAAALFDAFAALPGLTSAALVAALDAPGSGGPGLVSATKPQDRLVWQRSGRGLQAV
jgi:hypothetical protein